MANNHFSYFSRGYVVEYLDPGEDRCSSWLLLPAENLWPEWFRGLIYCIALFYFFVGIAIASDIFMCSIEVITARKRTISKWDPEKNEMVEREVSLGQGNTRVRIGISKSRSGEHKSKDWDK